MSWQDPQGPSDWRDPYGQYGQSQNPPYGPEPSDTPPYDQPPPYGPSPYGQGPYGQYPYGPPPAAGRNGMAVAALVANIVSAFLCCAGLVWIPGIVMAAIALSKAPTEPDAARKLSIAAWVCFAVNILLTVAAFVFFGLLGYLGDHSSTSP
jgi:uncharacterized membrane protein YqaE (UPF0057 family)